MEVHKITLYVGDRFELMNCANGTYYPVGIREIVEKDGVLFMRDTETKQITCREDKFNQNIYRPLNSLRGRNDGKSINRS